MQMDYRRRSSGSIPEFRPYHDKPTSYKRVSYRSFKRLAHSKSMPETISPPPGGIMSLSSVRNIIPKAKESIAGITACAKNKMKDSTSFSKMRNIKQKVKITATRYDAIIIIYRYRHNLQCFEKTRIRTYRTAL